MKKLILSIVLVASIFSLNNVKGTTDKETKKVTMSMLVEEGTLTLFQAALMYGYLEYLHNHIKPVDYTSSLGQTFDLGFKGFCGALFGNQAKSFFEKLVKFLAQKSKPLTSPALETIKGTL